MPATENTLAHQQTLTASRNLAVVEEAHASPEIQNLFEQFRVTFGRAEVPGILKCFATHPPLLEHMIGLARAMVFTEGVLGRANKEMIATFVSASNHCDYCADSHAAAFAQCGGSPEKLAAVLSVDAKSSSFNDAQQSLLLFVRKLSVDSATIQPSDIEILRNAGWTDPQIAETIHTTALFAFFNRVVSGFGLPSQNLLGNLPGKRPND
jgi:uncharacterized peroxidase-related enzyme